MTLTPRLAALTAALVLLAAGCSGDNDPGLQPADPTGPSSETPTGSPSADEPAAVVFHGGSGVTAEARCGGPSPTYLSLYEEFEVDREVRLGKVTLVGGGRLVGQVFVAPTSGRGRDDGTLAVDEEPGFGGVNDVPAWRDRGPLRGRVVEPGGYAAFAQVRLRPGMPLEAIDFGYSEGDTTSSARLDVSAAVTRTCRG